jgi:hypothetical protein
VRRPKVATLAIWPGRTTSSSAHVRQTDPAGLAHTGDFGLLVPVEHDRLGQAGFQFGHAPLGLAQLLLQGGDLPARGGPIQGGQCPGRLAVNRLATDALLLGVAADRAMGAKNDDEGTGNSLLGSYHAHG